MNNVQLLLKLYTDQHDTSVEQRKKNRTHESRRSWVQFPLRCWVFLECSFAFENVLPRELMDSTFSGWSARAVFGRAWVRFLSSVPHTCHVNYFTFHISLPSLKFTIFIHLPQCTITCGKMCRTQFTAHKLMTPDLVTLMHDWEFQLKK